MIKVVREPAEFSKDPAEHCCVCGQETRWWYEVKDVPVCPDCAARSDCPSIPSKADWIRNG
jgi:hypothetical protein